MADLYAGEKLQCDIVMKGGITSGVVYPGAVDELARRYRFRSIGGTSAGAIAAAIVAAAEHARQGGDPSGFVAVAELPAELAAEDRGRSLLLRLFQADAETKPVFDVVLGLMKGGVTGGLRSAVARFWRFPVAGAVVALACLALWLAAGADPAFFVLGVAVGLLVAAVGLGVDLVRAVLRLSEHDFGLCRLGPDSVGGHGQQALTGWLHDRIQAISGRGDDGVLTFADLWGADPDERDPAARLGEQLRLSRRPRDRVVDLQMMTTDLTHGRPWRLPVPYQPYEEILDDGDAGGLLFDPDELRRFFPADVVRHLCDRGGDPSAETQERLAGEAPDRSFKHFPIGPDLPVVVATRMSLSFPLLIAAVPLYKLDFQHDPPRLRRVVFSDGGISSNFPVHFFDGPLPTRPTFALNLTGFEPGDGPDPDDPCHAVALPRDSNARAFQPLAQFTSLTGFLTAIKDATQNWRDNNQARLPGYRDRVAHIRLDRGEGGLNLTMDNEKVLDLSARGACAGRGLIDLFAGPPGSTADTTHWREHRFVRFRVTMAVTERQLDGFAYGYRFAFGPGRAGYPTLVGQQAAAKPYPFNTRGRMQFALRRAGEYVELTESDETLDDGGVPRPPSILRNVPPV